MVVRSTMKPRGFVLIAAGIAVSVPLVLKMLKWATGAAADPKAPPPPLKTWRRLYRHTRRVVDSWARGVGLTSESAFGKELRDKSKRRAELVPFPPSRDELLELFSLAYKDATPSGFSAMLASAEIH